MKNEVLVKANDELVLLLDYCWMPLGITSVREGIKKLYTYGSKTRKNPKVKAINKAGEPVCWEDWVNSNTSQYYDNQPYIKCTSNVLPVPTIILTNSQFFNKNRKTPELSFLYKKYRGICQICGEHKHVGIMTREHVYPKALGGTLDWYNVTMSCQPCNSRKGMTYPYQNHRGETLEGTTYSEYERLLYKIVKREEWKNFIFR